MIDYIVYLTYLFSKYLFMIIPNIILKFLLKYLGYLIYFLNTEHTKIARINVNYAFKNTKNKEEKENIVKESYVSLLYNMYEFVENQYTSKEKILSKSKVINEDFVLKAKQENRKIIFITAHYGGWEQAIPYIALKYGTLAVVNRKMNNKRLNKLYVEARDNNGLIMYEKYEAGRGLMKSIKAGHNLAVAIDQNTKNGIEIEFFGHKTSATDTTSRLANKYNALIIPVFAYLNDFNDYTLEFKEPIDSSKIEADDKIQVLTQIQADVIEKVIKERPELWFWQHKRWKKYNKKLYNNLKDYNL